MPYNQFTLPKVVADFGLRVRTVLDLFPGIPSAPVPDRVRGVLSDNASLAVGVGTEAARSQLLVAPMLAEVWRARMSDIALFIGTRFDVDEAAGLNGVCDYILGRPPQLNYVTAPVLMIVEAKNEDIPGGLGQCAAQMVAASKFNAAHNPELRSVFGAVTDGTEWLFARLDKSDLQIGRPLQLIADPDHIFGILLHICGVNPAAPAAPVAA